MGVSQPKTLEAQDMWKGTCEQTDKGKQRNVKEKQDKLNDQEVQGQSQN